MRQLRITAGRITEKSQLLDTRLLDHRLWNIFRQHRCIRPVEHDAAAGFGDLRQLWLVRIDVALFNRELSLHLYRKRFLLFIRHIIKQVFHAAATQGKLELARR